jgi:hypothetical protein
MEGYQGATKAITVSESIRLTYKPEELLLGKNSTFELSKASDWTVRYGEELNSMRRETVAEGTGARFDLSPERPGWYFVYAGDAEVSRYKVEGVEASIWSLPTGNWLYVGGVILIVALVLVIFIRRSRRPTYGVAMPGGLRV